MALTVDVLVSLGVAAELVCCLGLVTMRSPLDRLHYAGAAATIGPLLIAAAVCVEEGLFSSSGLNALVASVLLSILGTGLATVIARVVRLKQQGTLEPSPAERERGS